MVEHSLKQKDREANLGDADSASGVEWGWGLCDWGQVDRVH